MREEDLIMSNIIKVSKKFDTGYRLGIPLSLAKEIGVDPNNWVDIFLDKENNRLIIKKQVVDNEELSK